MNKKKLLQFTALGFILSNIGAAVGLGNIWRFPERVLGGGGSSFILVYLIVLVIVALPVVILEINFGLFFRKGVTKTFHKTGGIFGTILGWKQIFLVGFLCAFYLVVLAWIAIGFVLSLVPSFFESWSSDKGWFDENILKVSPNGSVTSLSDLKFSPWVFAAICGLLVIIFFIVNAGIKGGLEKANYIFVPGLFIMLIGLTVYALFFLKDGSAGAEALFKFEGNKIQDPFIWYEATKQAIFSTGIIFGILITFAKSSDIRMDKGNEAIIIVVADTLIGLISGILVSALIANNIGQTEPTVTSLTGQERFDGIAQEIKEKFQDNQEKKSLGGSGLLLTYLPALFLRINDGASFGLGNALMIIFCLTLLFAGISSIIGLLEVFVYNLDENLPTKRTGNLLLWMGLMIVFFAIYSTSLGGSLVGEQDSIILLFIIIIGLMQILMFIITPYYQKIVKENDGYTFFKLAPFGWFRIFIASVTVPVLILIGIFGFLETFGLNYLIVNTEAFAKIKDNSQFFQTFYDKAKDAKLKLTITKLISFLMFGISIFLTFLFAVFSQKHQEKVALTKESASKSALRRLSRTSL